MRMIEPSWMLRIFCLMSFASGLALSVFTASLIHKGELEFSSSIILMISWNVLLLMILPIVLDWTERKYCKARFVQIEEFAQSNPELKQFLDEQCTKLSLSQLRIAVSDLNSSDCLTYGLWRQNPRLILPAKLIAESNKIVPSIEVELSRFARQDLTLLYFMFCAVEIITILVSLQLIH